jgi:DNA-binding PadR family transcriptional regulator
LKDTIEKLHSTNKARHDLEVRLYEENDKGKRLLDSLKQKEELLSKKQNEMEEFEKKYLDANRQCELMDTKKQAIER